MIKLYYLKLGIWYFQVDEKEGKYTHLVYNEHISQQEICRNDQM